MATSSTVEAPIELLIFLFTQWPEVKKTKVRQWLKHGAVLVNGEPVTQHNHPLKNGDQVSIRGRSELRAASALPADMKIVHEDRSLIVIEKPHNLLSMSSETERERTVYAMLTDYVRRGNAQSNARVWIVHRLDRETSGLMILAKTEEAKQHLQAQWESVEKKYLAIVEEAPPTSQGAVRSHLDESSPHKVFSVPRSDQTRLAVTHYRVIKRARVGTLVELTLETGRRNQIRVHMADSGCPIIGDRKYGARTNPIRRLALHAVSLQFKHPSSEQVLRFESPLPNEMNHLLKARRSE